MGLTASPTITFTGIEARQGILERAFAKPEFTRIHSVYSDIQVNEQIAFLQRFNKMTIKDAGCGTGKATKTLPMYAKQWTPEYTKFWLDVCWKDFTSSFFVWSLKKGINREDVTDTMLADYMLEVLPDAILDDLWRIVWFGDKDIADVADTPAGVLLSHDDIPYYSIIDGLWHQIFAGVAIGAGTWGHIPRYSIAENALGTFSLQLALTAGESLTIFRQMFYNADKRLRGDSKKVILCTQTIFDNWREYKESKVLESSFKNEDTEMEEGVYWSTPIIPVPIWDRIIQEDFQDGTKYNLPHRAILTTLDQLAVGFNGQQAGNIPTSFKTWLNNDTEKWNIKGGYQVDAKILENYLFSVAY